MPWNTAAGIVAGMFDAMLDRARAAGESVTTGTVDCY
jgi:hypothetical protein